MSIRNKISAACTNKHIGYDDKYYFDLYAKRVNSFYGFLIKLFYKYLASCIYAQPVKLRKGDKILDIGCGLGILVDQFNKLGFIAIGVDISPAALKGSICPAKCRLVKTTAELDYPNRFFDLVVSREALEHIPIEEIDDCIKEWDRVSKGKMVHIIAVSERGSSAIDDPIHINVQNEDWWIRKFKDYGYTGIKNPRNLFFSFLGKGGYLMFTK